MLSKKFKLAVGLGLLSAVFAAGCSNASAPQQLEQPPTAKTEAVYPDQCTVVDLNAGRYQLEGNAMTYNFRIGTLTFATGAWGDGYATRISTTVSLKDVAEDGQARALEMFAKLPASANCKAPKF